MILLRYRLIWLVAIVVFLLDWWTKSFVVSHFMQYESKLVIPHLLWLTFVQNPHGAFGLFGSSPFVLILLSLVVLALFGYAFREGVQHSSVVRAAFGMIVGGAAGNILDRFQHRSVVDFIDFKTIWPNVFNVADACITVGVALLILAQLRAPRHP